MSTEELSRLLVGLPLADRVDLAQALWESVHDQASPDADAEAAALARRRDAELAAGAVAGRSHEQVMEAARQLLRCG